MTKVEQLIYNDVEKKYNEKIDSIAINLINRGDSLKDVAECTGIDLRRVKKLAKNTNA